MPSRAASSSPNTSTSLMRRQFTRRSRPRRRWRRRSRRARRRGRCWWRGWRPPPRRPGRAHAASTPDTHFPHLDHELEGTRGVRVRGVESAEEETPASSDAEDSATARPRTGEARRGARGEPLFAARVRARARGARKCGSSASTWTSSRLRRRAERHTGTRQDTRGERLAIFHPPSQRAPEAAPRPKRCSRRNVTMTCLLGPPPSAGDDRGAHFHARSTRHPLDSHTETMAAATLSMSSPASRTCTAPSAPAAGARRTPILPDRPSPRALFIRGR